MELRSSQKNYIIQFHSYRSLNLKFQLNSIDIKKIEK